MSRPWPSLFLTKKQKATMPYLRGSTKKGPSSYSKPSIQNQLNTLKRQVGRNTPAKEFWRKTYAKAPVGAGHNQTTIDLTSDFINNVNFRDTVNGDKFNNWWGHLNITSVAGVKNCRIVAYVPKKPGTTWAPALSGSGYVDHADPHAFWVIADRQMTLEQTTYPSTMKVRLNLRGMQTLYNTSSSVLERGDIRILIMWDTVNTSGTDVFLGAQLCVSDK